MQITLRHDPERSIPVPHAERSADGRVRWARERAYTFAASAGLGADSAERIAAALADIAAATGDDHRSLLLLGPDARVLAPLTVFVADEQVPGDQQAAFLWSSRALLPATTEIVETENLGAGISATLLERHGERDFGFRRWLFVGENASVGGVLGPVAPYGLVFVEEVAAAILRDSTVEGFVPGTDRTRVESLDRVVTRVGEEWAL